MFTNTWGTICKGNERSKYINADENSTGNSELLLLRSETNSPYNWKLENYCTFLQEVLIALLFLPVQNFLQLELYI